METLEFKFRISQLCLPCSCMTRSKLLNSSIKTNFQSAWYTQHYQPIYIFPIKYHSTYSLSHIHKQRSHTKEKQKTKNPPYICIVSIPYIFAYIYIQSSTRKPKMSAKYIVVFVIYILVAHSHPINGGRLLSHNKFGLDVTNEDNVQLLLLSSLQKGQTPSAPNPTIPHNHQREGLPRPPPPPNSETYIS